MFRNPLPPAAEHAVFRDIRNDAELPSNQVLGPRFEELGSDIKSAFDDEFDTLAERHNPIVRRIVRRTRTMLEERGLLKKIAVLTHPKASDGLPLNLFDGQGLAMNFAFQEAYKAAEKFSQLYAARQPGAGFLKTILLRRIGSSAKAGLDTARRLLGRLEGEIVPEQEQGDEVVPDVEKPVLEGEELRVLRDGERNLASVVEGADIDPKVKVILHFLKEHQWLEKNGAIIFSQYFTTAE